MHKLNFIYILAFACFISRSSWDKSDALPVQTNPIAQHITNVLKTQNDLHTLPVKKVSSLATKRSELEKDTTKTGAHAHPALSTKFIELLAQGDENVAEEDSKYGQFKADEQPVDTAGGGGGNDVGNAGGTGNGTDTGGVKPPVEITVSVPKFQFDEMGNRIYHVWGATFGNIWGDTRFNRDRFTIPRIKIDSNAVNNYYPDGPLSTVCFGSTVYNVPPVVSWLRRNVHLEEFKTRPIWDDLRREIYAQGKSEECHNITKFTEWLDYEKCAVKRNQRMEYLIPKYPLHQLGFKGKYSKLL